VHAAIEVHRDALRQQHKHKFLCSRDKEDPAPEAIVVHRYALRQQHKHKFLCSRDKEGPELSASVECAAANPAQLLYKH
jgi:hypothetical protein